MNEKGADKMKKNKTIIWLLLAAMLLGLAGCGNSTGSGEETHSENVTDHSENTGNGTESVSDRKTLIVYYSYSGTTERVAEHLQKLTNGDLYELELQNPYTGNSNEVLDRVFEERGEERMPELSGELPELSEYDQILIGTPVWNADMAEGLAIRSANGLSDDELDEELNDWLQQDVEK